MIPKRSFDFRYNSKLPYWVSFTRASAAWGFVNGVLTEFATNKPRIISGQGLQYEDEAENIILYSRDTTNAAWTTVDLSGGGGVLNLSGEAGIVLTAEEDNGNISQQVTADESVYCASVYLLSLSTNVGEIYISMDGTNWLQCDVSPTEWRRFYLSSTTADPSIYVKIGTQGDSVSIDCVQIELGYKPSSPIPTTSAAVTRSADLMYTDYFDFSANTWNWLGAEQGVFQMQCKFDSIEPNTVTLLDLFYYLDPSPPSVYFKLQLVNSDTHSINAAFGTDYLFDYQNQISENINVAVSYSQTEQIVSFNGQQSVTAAGTETFDLSDDNRMYFGCNHDGTQHMNGFIQSFAADNKPCSQNELNLLTQSVSPYVAYGTDDSAEAFIEAAGITDETQKLAIYLLTYLLKKSELWYKVHAFYPIVGGTATSHKYNLINPDDSDAAFRLTFAGGWTHDANGAKPNGTNAYADPHLVQSSDLALNSASFGIYYNESTSASDTDFEGSGGGGGFFGGYMFGVSPYMAVYISSSSDSYAVPAPTTSVGFRGASRIDSSNILVSVDDAVNTYTKASVTASTASFYFGARNLAGTPDNYCVTRRCTQFLADGLTEDEMKLMNTYITQYNTILGR